MAITIKVDSATSPDEITSPNEIISALENGSYQAGEFNHAAHVQTAWAYLSRDGFDAGSTRFITEIQRFATLQGAPEKYHETVTRALLQLIWMHMKMHPCQDYSAFQQANPALYGDTRRLLLQHYSSTRLQSARAKTTYLAPDIRPLPSA